MNLRNLLILCLWLFSLSAVSQEHHVKVDFSYFATKNPVFKVGYEWVPDSSQWTFGAHAELGRYASNTKSINYSTISEYELSGYGGLIESKYFILPEKGETCYGGFVSAFALLRSLREIHTGNIILAEEGYDLRNLEHKANQGLAMHYGLAVGYRSGCYAGPIHFEILAGYGIGKLNLNEDQSGFRSRVTNFITQDDYLRLELNLILEIN